MKKILVLTLALVFCMAAGTTVSYGDRWVKADSGWHYVNSSGKNVKSQWVKSGNTWYYIDGKGKMVSGKTFSIGGATYEFARNGAMITGWKKDGNAWKYYKTNGAQARNGWLKINGSWYYFEKSGKMVANTVKKIGGRDYYFESSGKMKTGWFKVKKQWCYADDSGKVMKNTWHKISGSWYYFKRSGAYASNEILTISNKKYGFDSQSKNFTGWKEVKGKLYYADSNGVIQRDCWVKEGDSYYRLSKTGEKIKGKEITIEGDKYRLDESGKMVTGWYEYNGKWSYYEKSGKKKLDVKGKVNSKGEVSVEVDARSGKGGSTSPKAENSKTTKPEKPKKLKKKRVWIKEKDAYTEQVDDLRHPKYGPKHTYYWIKKTNGQVLLNTENQEEFNQKRRELHKANDEDWTSGISHKREIYGYFQKTVYHKEQGHYEYQYI